LTRESLKKEGSEMHHCVGGYHLTSERRIFSLIGREDRSTLEISLKKKTWVIVQNHSYNNRWPANILVKAGNTICKYLNRQIAREKKAKEAEKRKAEMKKLVVLVTPPPPLP
jgi:hypothetical protein